MASARHETFRELGLRFFMRAHTGQVREPLATPAAWRGPELAAHDEWVYRLTDRDIAEIDAAVERVRRRGLDVVDVGRDDFELPTLAATIAGWVREIESGRGFVLVKGLPVERYGEADASVAFWGIGQHVGVPGGQNPADELLGHVRDTGESERNPNVRAYQTTAHIAYHADLSDVVALLCMRPGRSGGLSRIVSSVAIYNELLRLRPELVGLLYDDWCLDRRDEQGAGELPYVPIAICRHAGGKLTTFYHSDYLRSAQRHDVVPRFTIEQRELLDLYEEIAGSPAFYLDMSFDVGDMQFLSNRVVLHSRTAYDDFTEPERKRHLLRLWLSSRDDAG